MLGIFVKAFLSYNITFGSAFGSNSLLSDKMSHTMLMDELEHTRLKEGFSGGVFTAENACKPAYLYEAPYKYNFTKCDTEIEIAEKNNMSVRFHTMFWPTKQSPTWTFVDSNVSFNARDVMFNMINETMHHYNKRVKYYELINEYILKHNHRRSEFKRQLGDGYIETVLSMARNVSSAMGVSHSIGINEWGVGESFNWRTKKYYNIVKPLIKKGLIDYVGFQMHNKAYRINYRKMYNALRKFTNLGVDIHFTEVDYTKTKSIRRLKYEYKKLTNVCKRLKKCKVIQTWGVSDKFSWKSTKRPNNGVLYSMNRTLKFNI